MNQKKINCILLVDDDYISNFITQKLLMKLNIANRVMIITNGKDALNFISEYHQTYDACPDLMLIDVNMPEMNGFEFLERLDDLNLSDNHSTTVMLTASSSPRDKIKVDELGITDFMEKPLTREKIELIIKKASLNA